MKNVYSCPHCDTVLNPSVKILLVLRHKKTAGMILLSPQPGNFHFICDPKLQVSLTEGEMVHFACPVCSADLTSPRDDGFAELMLETPGHEPRHIEFSRRFGTQATFIIDGDDVRPYGRDVDDSAGTNFFGS